MDLTTFLGTSLAATLGAFVLNWVRTAMTESKEAVGLMRAMLLDVTRMEEDARTFIEKQTAAAAQNPPTVFTPAQRMPTTFIDAGLEKFATGKRMKVDELSAMHSLSNWAHQANRCLARLSDLALRQLEAAALTVATVGEANRVVRKCEHILREVPLARTALLEAIARSDWPSVND
jgi:hypothetical protein